MQPAFKSHLCLQLRVHSVAVNIDANPKIWIETMTASDLAIVWIWALT
jgi:hypothetical protein